MYPLVIVTLCLREVEFGITALCVAVCCITHARYLYYAGITRNKDYHFRVYIVKQCPQ